MITAAGMTTQDRIKYCLKEEHNETLQQMVQLQRKTIDTTGTPYGAIQQLFMQSNVLRPKKEIKNSEK